MDGLWVSNCPGMLKLIDRVRVRLRLRFGVDRSSMLVNMILGAREMMVSVECELEVESWKMGKVG